MQFADVTYVGPPVDDLELLDELPAELAAILRRTNGLIAYRGGLHVRGACLAPAWHSLRGAWRGAQRIAARYPGVRATDIPFAEDAVGDQFLLREGAVYRLSGETGEVEGLGVALTEFFALVQRDAIAYLGLQPLIQFEREGCRLEPGQLLSAYPPFCTAESERGVSLRAVDHAERIGFLADLAAQIRDLPPGAKVQFKTTP